jgi:hypothetical protein
MERGVIDGAAHAARDRSARHEAGDRDLGEPERERDVKYDGRRAVIGRDKREAYGGAKGGHQHDDRGGSDDRSSENRRPFDIRGARWLSEMRGARVDVSVIGVSPFVCCSAQTEEGKNGHDDNDKTDEIDDAVHDFLHGT